MSPCIRIPYGIACRMTDGPFKMNVGGKTIHFEFGDYIGPVRVNRDGEPSKRDFSDGDFAAITLWARQGKRVDKFGRCIWQPEGVPA